MSNLSAEPKVCTCKTDAEIGLCDTPCTRDIRPTPLTSKKCCHNPLDGRFTMRVEYDGRNGYVDMICSACGHGIHIPVTLPPEMECSLCAEGMNSFTDPATGKKMHARNGVVVLCSAAVETKAPQCICDPDCWNPNCTVHDPTETTTPRAGWPETITLPVNRGYVVTAAAPTMCIHGIQLAHGDAYKPCQRCFGLCTSFRPALKTERKEADSPVTSDNCEHGLPRRFCTAVHEPFCPTCKTELAFDGDVCGLCNPVAQP